MVTLCDYDELNFEKSKDGNYLWVMCFLHHHVEFNPFTYIENEYNVTYE